MYAPHGRADHKYRWQIGQLNTFVAMNARYNAAGQMTNLLVLNSHNQTFSYNGRNQLTEHKVQASGGGAVHLHTRYSYAEANDGRLSKQLDVLSGEEVTYTYDALARLVRAETNDVAGAWGQAYDYDGFGNQYAQRVVKGSAPGFSLTPNSATNRIVQFSYDANGNVTNDGTRGYSYDVENRLEANELGQRYSYGPDNRRVWDGTGYVFWSPDGKRIGRYTMQAAWTQAGGWSYVFQTVRTNVYFAGRLIGQSDAAPGTTFVPVVTDRLGSVRLRGGTAMNYFPFGDERGTVTAQGQEKFGTYLRDSNGLDYADQRYYASRYARFMTADPYLASGGVGNPSGWNRYAYVEGDPVNRVDFTGLIPGDAEANFQAAWEWAMRALLHRYTDDPNEENSCARLFGIARDPGQPNVIAHVLLDLKEGSAFWIDRQFGNARGAHAIVQRRMVTGPTGSRVRGARIIFEDREDGVWKDDEFATSEANVLYGLRLALDPAVRSSAAAIYRASIILHEIGHAFNTVLDERNRLLYGGSAMRDDTFGGTLRNNDLIWNECFAPLLGLPRVTG